MKPRVKLALLCVLSYIVSILPLVITFAFNLDKYTKSAEATVKLTIGGLIVLVLLLIRTLGKTIPGGIGGALIAFILAFLLEAIIADLVLLLGMFLLGECLDIIFIRRRIATLREDILVDKTAKATADQVEAVFKKYNGGRV
jgi:hypothetical protein